MEEEKNNASPPANIGISLLLVVFLTLCLFTFSAIALVQANSEWKNASLTKEARDAYFAAVNLAESEIYQYNRAIDNGEAPSAEVLVRSYEINDEKELLVEMQLIDSEYGPHYVFTSFKTVVTTEWSGDEMKNTL